MNHKTVKNLAFAGIAVCHVFAFVADVERYVNNLNLFIKAPTPRNLVRLLLAEGILISDLE